ncbi:hypothetical protein [Tateyamaria sp. ANG-S1]|uniref:hypothetical protein n=1 Tax=Tateyamaria sp. ANG-S1 TaxID=1577905 RepID=UPI00057CD6F2|nr:hypothetical protein [Tateyamaria sp. ANG-S1]KIC48125.1 hypothetical protein RA29_18245 [Tateyamaria sp. ANG-S1]
MADKNLSGLAWFKANQSKYPNSNKISALASGFKTSVQAFEKALKAAGATIIVSSTKRNKSRAYIMRYAWDVANKKTAPDKVPKITGVDINWDHGDAAKSIKAAKEMIGSSGFNIAYKPSLTSRHIEGKAIDWTIKWNKELKIKDKKGKEVVIKSSPKSGQNKELHAVGKTYGVVKLASDPPHWSTDGR